MRVRPSAPRGTIEALRTVVAGAVVVALSAACLVTPTSARAAPADLDAPSACTGADCERRQRAWETMQRASTWMARFPPGELRFDSAVILSQIRTSADSAMLRSAFETARARADVDVDHPHRRFWDPNLRSAAKDTAGWTAPAAGSPRVNPNLVVSEALHCTENGFRPETTAYVCGAMRDAGGYHTTHGLWALALARDRGCVDAGAVAACVAALQAETAAAQPEALRPGRTLDVDLYGERLLMLILSGATDPVSEKAIERSVDGLLAARDADGSFGVRAPDELPYHRFHATGVATWALAEWQRRETSRTVDAKAAPTDAPSGTTPPGAAAPTAPAAPPAAPSIPSP